MGLLDSVKGMFTGKKGAQTKTQAQKIAQKVDDQAAKLATKDGVVGTVAEKAHEIIDKIDGD
jgi:pimeloyl-CoA synthetase